MVPGSGIEPLTSSLPMTRTTTVLTGRIEGAKSGADSTERPKNGLHGFCTDLYAFSCSVLRICAVLRRDSFVVRIGDKRVFSIFPISIPTFTNGVLYH